jgi:hypothetical protein
MPIVREERKTKGKVVKMVPEPEQGDRPSSFVPRPPAGQSSSRRESRPIERRNSEYEKPPKKGKPPEPNRPRVIGEIKLPEGQTENKAYEQASKSPESMKPEPPRRTGLLAELERIKGRALETSKSKVERQIEAPKIPSSRPVQPPPKAKNPEPVVQVKKEEEPEEHPRTLTVFKRTPSSGNEEHKTLRPGQRVTF